MLSTTPDSPGTSQSWPSATLKCLFRNIPVCTDKHGSSWLEHVSARRPTGPGADQHPEQRAALSHHSLVHHPKERANLSLVHQPKERANLSLVHHRKERANLSLVYHPKERANLSLVHHPKERANHSLVHHPKERANLSLVHQPKERAICYTAFPPFKLYHWC